MSEPFDCFCEYCGFVGDGYHSPDCPYTRSWREVIEEDDYLNGTDDVSYLEYQVLYLDESEAHDE